MNSGFLVTWKGSKVKVRWGSMPEADTCEIYAAYCGTGGCRKVKTVHGVTHDLGRALALMRLLWKRGVSPVGLEDALAELTADAGR